jgi:aldehyde dehydrogenase (NAD+)
MADHLLSFDPKSVVLPKGHFIDGKSHETREDTLEVLRPSDGNFLGVIPDASADTVDLAVASATAALRASGWATQSPRERGRVLLRWADLIDANALELAQLEAVGSTRPVAAALSQDVPFTAEAIRFFGEFADKLGGDIAATRHQSLGFVASEPYGVIGAIAPWNFPLSMCSWKCGPALAAGNAVVLKPSELTPFSTIRLAQLAIEAGMPPGIFNVVHGRGVTAGSALVRHPGVGKISFTGSTRTGSGIMRDIADSGIKPVTLELGGKSPQLVFGSVTDLEHVAQCITRGLISNAGQACVAGTRLIAHRSVAERLVELVTAMFQDARPGVTWDAETTYSPIVSQAQASRIDSIVKESVSGGAEIIAGGGYFSVNENGRYYQPTILGRVGPQSPALIEELFGPVLTVQTFEDEQEGIELAAHPSYGLAAGIYTNDIGQALRAMRAIEAGTIWINRYGRSGDMIIPTGGFNRSGVGKDLGRQAMEGSMRHKSVLIDF